MTYSGHRESCAIPAVMHIDLDALAFNFRRIKARLPATKKLIPVIKANAYGHGVEVIGKTLSRLGADHLAVDSHTDALALARSIQGQSIWVLSPMPVNIAAEIVTAGCVPTVASREAITALKGIDKENGAIPILVEVDCGFGRFGIPLGQTLDFLRWADTQAHVEIACLYTHIPFADRTGQQWATDRLSAFEIVVEELKNEGLCPPLVQALASPGLVAGLSDRSNAVAVGHILFGLNPTGPDLTDDFLTLDLKPVLTGIATELISICPLDSGYEKRSQYLRRPITRTGTVPMGLAHGFRTPPENQDAFMLIGGNKAPILRVCLGSTILDLTNFPKAKVGDPVLLLSTEHGLDVKALATAQGATPLALLTSLGQTLPKSSLSEFDYLQS